jgi:hypothetical protein
VTSGLLSSAGWREIDTGLPSSVVGQTYLTIDPANPATSGCRLSSLLVMDPANPQVLYVVEIDPEDGGGWPEQGGGWLRKSLDGGASWSYTGLPFATVNALVIDPANQSTLYAGTNEANPIDIDGLSVSGGLLKSADGGASWSSTGLMNTTVNLLAIDPAHTNILYALTKDVRGPFKSR